MLRGVSSTIIRTVTASAVVGAGGYSLYTLHRNDYDLSSIRAVRATRATVVVSKMIVDYKWTMWRNKASDSEYTKKLSAAHKRGAERLLGLARANGGLFVKVGQYLSALHYLVPAEYIETLRVLHSRAPESDLKDARKVIEEDLHAKLEEVFVEFDRRPEGAASLAQVYRARLRSSGEEVAVKVQHPRVKGQCLMDLASMELLVKLAAKLFADFHFLWLVEEMKRLLPLELDFTNEASNADKLRQLCSHFDFLKIPKVYHEYTTTRVLTTEFCKGAQINDLDYFNANNIDRYDVCRKLGAIYSEMIFSNGIVHCDPHPGNILISKEPNGKVSIILLDHATYSTIPEEFRLNYARLWLAILKRDLKAMKEHSAALGIHDMYEIFASIVTGRSWKAIQGGVDKSVPGNIERDELWKSASAMLPQITQVVERMPRPLLLIMRTNNILRSMEYNLGTQNRADTFLQMSRCCIRSVYEDSARKTGSLISRLFFYTAMYWKLFSLLVYERYLMLTHRQYATSTVAR